METTKPKENAREKRSYRPVIGIAIMSLLVCGLFFPLLITALAQVLMPYQANGELVQLDNKNVGSNLIAQNFDLPLFFHPRNDSGSGVDPDITIQDAYSQIQRIHDATGIASSDLKGVIDRNTEGTLWIFGSPYVNVLRINLILIRAYPSVYENFT
jgi:K+-transporting ATPase ATPase C chain